MESLGQGSKKYLLLLGGIAVIVIITIVVSGVIVMPVTPVTPPQEEPEEESGPVFEVEIGDIRFKLENAKDRGEVLESPRDQNPYAAQVPDLTTKEKFIEVTISAENIGKENLQTGAWDVKELIDGEERRFSYSAATNPWIPKESNCGALLKPGFSPTLCTKIYEAAKISNDLKVRIFSKQQTKTAFYKEGEAFIDLGF